MSKEWIQIALKIIRFWIWQLLIYCIGIAIVASVAIKANLEGIAITLPLFIIVNIATTVIYALKIANFFRCANSSGGALITIN